MARRGTPPDSARRKDLTGNTSTARQRAAQDAVVDAWLAQPRAVNTRLAYRSDLDVFGNWCVRRGSMPLNVDAATLAEFDAARRAAGDSPSTLRRRWSSLSSFYRFAVDSEVIDVNPLDADRVGPAAPRQSTTAVLSPLAIDAYLATAAALDPRLEALVGLLVFEGVKLGEALVLDVDDVRGRPPKVSLLLRRHGQQQRIGLSEVTARAVHRCVGQRHGEPLFISARPAGHSSAPQRLTRYGADHLIRQLTAPGEQRVTSNVLRRYHFAASADAGIDPRAMAAATGLADVGGLRRYRPPADPRSDSADAEA